MKTFTIVKMVYINSNAGTVIPSRACVTLYHTHIITELLHSARVCTKQAQTIRKTLCNKLQIRSIFKIWHWTFYSSVLCLTMIVLCYLQKGKLTSLKKRYDVVQSRWTRVKLHPHNVDCAQDGIHASTGIECSIISIPFDFTMLLNGILGNPRQK